MPKKAKKLEAVYRENGTLLKTEKSMKGPVWRFGGSLRATVYIMISALKRSHQNDQKRPTASRTEHNASSMNPSTRIVHWNLGGQSGECIGLKTRGNPETDPIFCMRFLTMIGYNVPERLEPKAMVPKASPSFRLNQWAGVPITIPKIIPHAS